MLDQQLTLAVTLPDDETFLSFYGDDNEHVVHHLQQLMANPPAQFNFCYLCGLAEAGKSHLLYAACVTAQERGLSNMLLALKDHDHLTPDILHDLEQIDVVCIDDLHLIAGLDGWERALFNFFNRFNEPGKVLLVSADQLPDALDIHLPDLLSRLKWGTTFQVRSINNDDKVFALVKRAQLRGFELTEEAARFLVARVSRDMRSLMDHLDKLDRASMRHKRKLTIPFIKEILQL